MQIGLSKQASNASAQGPAIAVCMHAVHASVVGPNEQIKPPPDEVVTAVVVEDTAIVLALVADTLVADTLVADTFEADTLEADTLVVAGGAPPDPPSPSRTTTLDPHAATTNAASVKATAFCIACGC